MSLCVGVGVCLKVCAPLLCFGVCSSTYVCLHICECACVSVCVCIAGVWVAPNLEIPN